MVDVKALNGYTALVQKFSWSKLNSKDTEFFSVAATRGGGRSYPPFRDKDMAQF